MHYSRLSISDLIRSATPWPGLGLAALAALVISFTSVGIASAARFDFDATPGRLPKDVVPTHYTLKFELDPARDTFEGRAEIDIKVRRPAASIVLQATDLDAKAVTLTNDSGVARDVVLAPDKDTGLWRIAPKSGEPLAPGQWRLRIDYRGKANKRAQGLYRVEYRTAGREAPRFMLATQLEPTHARAVFPAFDEPAFRATFDIVITAPAQYASVSNMPVTRQTDLPDGRRDTVFARTPSMPTYLVALAVGEFGALTDSFDGIALRILTAPGREEEARYAMGITKQLLGYYRDYFGVPYMLPKLDQLAIPGVRNGAMEDWGVISYNENFLLYDPKRSAPRQQQRVFWIVAHEIAHQWFGNLVTAAWWDDIWLNEAFATWMENKTQAHFNPAWNSKTRERLVREKALALDARKATRAVADPPAHETGIFEVFDDITYQKGGAVLGMFEAQIGEERFRAGLRNYMAAHRYSNATADDLWYHLSQAAERDLAAAVGGWIRQRGFPLLKVTAECKQGRTQVELSQERFTAGRANEPPATWQIPVVLHAGTKAERLMLGLEPTQVAFAGCVPVIANGGDTGYYRVQYNAANMARLHVAYSQLPSTERIGLVADTMALARSGRIEFAEYFRLLEAVQGEREGAVWQQVIENLEYLDDVFAGTAVQRSVRDYGRHLLQPVMRRVGWEPRSSDDAGTLRLRDAVIDTLGRFEDPEVTVRARQMFADHAGSRAVPIDPSIRNGVVRTAARTADTTTFEALRRFLKQADNQEDNHLFGGAMICVRDWQLVLRILELGLTDEWPPGNASWYLRNVGYHSGHSGLAKDFILKNFEAVQAKASRWGRSWTLPDTFAGFNDNKEADQLLAVQRRLVSDDAMAAAEQIAEAIREKAAVRDREEKRLPELLQSFIRDKPRMAVSAL
jgi:aminopeptidase N